MILTGLARLGRDAELRYTQSGDAVANLSLAFNYGKKDNEGKQPTQWIEGTLWGKRAEALAPHLTKGTMISIVGDEPHIEEFDKKDGTKGFKLAARILSLDFAGGRRDEQSAPNSAGTAAQRPAPSAAKPAPGADPFAGMDDDIPF